MKHLGIVAAVFLAACTSGTPKPQPMAVEGIIDESTAIVYQAAIAALADEGIPLRLTDPEARLVESNYVNVGTYFPGSMDMYPARERQVRFKIFVAADTLGRGSTVGIQALYMPFQTGVYSERNERALPKGHPGLQLAQRIYGHMEDHATL